MGRARRHGGHSVRLRWHTPLGRGGHCGGSGSPPPQRWQGCHYNDRDPLAAPAAAAGRHWHCIQQQQPHQCQPLLLRQAPSSVFQLVPIPTAYGYAEWRRWRCRQHRADTATRAIWVQLQLYPRQMQLVSRTVSPISVQSCAQIKVHINTGTSGTVLFFSVEVSAVAVVLGSRAGGARGTQSHARGSQELQVLAPTMRKEAGENPQPRGDLGARRFMPHVVIQARGTWAKWACRRILAGGT